MKHLILCLCLLGLWAPGQAQSTTGGYHFGLKLGPTLANQNWNGADIRPLFTYHINAFVESRDPNEKGALFAQLGLHNRGSSIFINRVGNLNRSTGRYRFRNLALMVGAKKLLDTQILGAQPYYLIGIRGEYSFSNNMREQQELFNQIFASIPIQEVPTLVRVEPAFAQQWLYGISLGAGFKFEGTEFFDTALEFTLSPDLNFQYNRLPGAVGTNSSALQIRNVSFEISLVLKFLREIIYE